MAVGWRSKQAGGWHLQWDFIDSIRRVKLVRASLPRQPAVILDGASVSTDVLPVSDVVRNERGWIKED